MTEANLPPPKMRLLALDLSTSTGWASYEMPLDNPVLVGCGRIALGDTAHGYNGHPYPWDLVKATERMATSIVELVKEQAPERIVIEETNMGRQRYSQKILEQIHLQVLQRVEPLGIPVFYYDSSEWRKVLGVRVSKEDRRQNAKLSRAKSRANATGAKLDKKVLGIKGRITIKHATILFVNNHFGMELKMADNDIADAIALGLAALRGAQPCDGT